MSLPEHVTVLIVGAGPTGLAAALSLHEQGIHDVIIVDAVAQGDNASRAMVVHAATLEALDTIGCANAMVQAGNPIKSVTAMSNSGPIFSINFSSLAQETKFPFALLLPQDTTERVLGKEVEKVGVKVFRPYKVVGMTRNEHTPNTTDVQLESGEVMRAKYVIGADGARSVVRQITGIGFSDPDGQKPDEAVQVVLADVVFTPAPDSSEMIGGYLLPSGFFLLAPLPENWRPVQNIYRIVCNIPTSYGPVPQGADTEWLQKLVDDLGPSRLSSKPTNPHPIRITQTLWSSRFRTHSAIADRFFTRFKGNATLGDEGEGNMEAGGVIFLVGDAAHIHSPAGGQGMNLGLRDAIKLGPQLASHIRANDSTSPDNPPSTVQETDKLLSNFAAARRDRALTVIKLTKSLNGPLGMTHLGESAISRWMYFARRTALMIILRFLGRFESIRNKAAHRLSGLEMP